MKYIRGKYCFVFLFIMLFIFIANFEVDYNLIVIWIEIRRSCVYVKTLERRDIIYHIAIYNTFQKLPHCSLALSSFYSKQSILYRTTISRSFRIFPIYFFCLSLKCPLKIYLIWVAMVSFRDKIYLLSMFSDTTLYRTLLKQIDLLNKVSRTNFI